MKVHGVSFLIVAQIIGITPFQRGIVEKIKKIAGK